MHGYLVFDRLFEWPFDEDSLTSHVAHAFIRYVNTSYGISGLEFSGYIADKVSLVAPIVNAFFYAGRNAVPGVRRKTPRLPSFNLDSAAVERAFMGHKLTSLEVSRTPALSSAI